MVCEFLMFRAAFLATVVAGTRNAESQYSDVGDHGTSPAQPATTQSYATPPWSWKARSTRGQIMAAEKTLSCEQLDALLANSPYQKLLGLRLEWSNAAAQSVVIRCVYGPNVERARGTGQYHGGVIASLIDIAGDFALIAILGHGVPTINLRVDYLRPATATDLTATARVRRAGRTLAVVDIDVEDSAGHLVAIGRGCYGTQAG